MRKFLKDLDISDKRQWVLCDHHEDPGTRLFVRMFPASGIDRDIGVNEGRRAHGPPPVRERVWQHPVGPPPPAWSAARPPVCDAPARHFHRRRQSGSAPLRRWAHPLLNKFLQSPSPLGIQPRHGPLLVRNSLYGDKYAAHQRLPSIHCRVAGSPEIALRRRLQSAQNRCQVVDPFSSGVFYKPDECPRV